LRLTGYISLLLFCFYPGLYGQYDYRVLDWKSESTLRNYLLQDMHKQYDIRREYLDEALVSETKLLEYQSECRERYLSLLDCNFSDQPLNAVVTKHSIFEGYAVETVIFESKPLHHVTADLYLPDLPGPHPAVLMFSGHEMTSKATESYVQTAVLFAVNGFVVLVVDPISQGERVQFTDQKGQRILRGSTTEHTILNAGASLVGNSVVAWELSDNKRALDYLVSRPEVDTSRIGCLGNSGGGTQTTYFIAGDNRIKVAAPCSFVAQRERNFELTGANDGCQHLAGEGANRLEISDYLIMFAPKPILILAGRYDFVDYTGTVAVYDELRKVYEMLNAPDRVALFTFDDGHGISSPKRVAAVKWFRQWLCNDIGEIDDISYPLPGEDQLNSTVTGQVNSTFSGEIRLQDYSLSEALELQTARETFAEVSTLAEKQKKIKELLAIDAKTSKLYVEYKNEIQRDGYSLKKIIIRRDGEVPLPCIIYTPMTQHISDTAIIWIDPENKSRIALCDSLIAPYLNGGMPVIVADLRGMGEMAEKSEDNDPKYYNREYNNAMLSIHNGRPLPGQRTEDILALVEFMCPEGITGEKCVKIIAGGAAAPSAYFAAALDKRIMALESYSTIESYIEILEQPTEKDWYSYVIPGVLKYFDLSDVKSMRPDLPVINRDIRIWQSTKQ